MRFVFDIDGTLCFNGISIDQSIVLLIKKKEALGYDVMFASARLIRDLLPVVRDFSHNHLIGGNGSIVSTNE